MNEERLLKKLGSAAAGERPPRIDVADRVVADLAGADQPAATLLWLFTAATSAAAAAVAVVALWVSSARQDPFGEFLESMMAVMQ